MGHQHSTRLADFLNVFVVLVFLLVLFTFSAGAQAQGAQAATVGTATLTVAPAQITATETPSPTPSASATATVQDPSIGETESPTAVPTATEEATPVATVTATSSPAVPTPTPGPLPTNVPGSDEVVIDPATGGRLIARQGDLMVEFPGEAVTRTVKVKLARRTSESAPSERGPRRVVNQFALNAFDVTNLTRAVKRFDRPVTITLRYDPQVLGGWQESDLQIVYWDETAQNWLPVETAVDTVNHQLVAKTTHFTDFGLTSAPDVQSYLPNLEGFQTDLFSGAAGFSYPLQVPPGKGGLAPNLALSYSSAGVDMLNSSMQVSYVGAGWSLSNSYIARDTRNTYTTADDVFTLVLNGAGYDLVLGQDNYYHTSKEQYWQIRPPQGSTLGWQVKTNDGTIYSFGNNTNSQALEWRTPGYGYAEKDFYIWALDRVTDTLQNTIAYTYLHETSTTGGCTTDGTPYDRAIYPLTITYNAGRSQIILAYTDRLDYHYEYPARQCGPAPFQKKRLDSIDVRTKDEYDVVGHVRRYEFSYDYSAFPGVYNNHNDGTGSFGRLTLKTITQYGRGDATTLPPYTFTYYNNRLRTGNNGIGGKVTYIYDMATAGPAGDKYDQDYRTWSPGAEPYAFWKSNTGLLEITDDSAAHAALVLRPTSPPANPTYMYWSVDPFTPGATYVLTNTLSTAQGIGDPNYQQVQIRLWNGSSEQTLTGWLDLPYGQVRTYTTTVTLPDNARAPELRMYTRHAFPPYDPATIAVEHTILQPQSTHHRVTTKTLDDGLGNTSSYTYTYTGIAVNDAAHSSSARTAHPRHALGSEFRGHAQVAVTDPAGNQTVTNFGQWDMNMGRVTQTFQQDSAGHLYFTTTNTISSTTYAVSPSNPTTGDRIDFVKVLETTQATYDGYAGAPSTRRTTYQYDSYGNVSETAEYDAGAALYRRTVREYYGSPAGKHILNKVARVRVLNIADATLNETRYLYDGHTYYNQMPDVGELTQVLVTSDGTTFYPSATYTYVDGNVHTITNARSFTETIDYDPVYHIFPVATTNALNQVTTSEYDYVLGQMVATTDPNGARTSQTYDVFGRLTALKLPFEQSHNPTAEYDYVMGSTDNPSRVHVSVRKDLGGSSSPEYQEAWWFYNGKGQLIQQQAQGLNNQTIIVDTAYDALGRVYRTSNPYTVTITAGTYHTPYWTRPFSERQYDPVGRLIKTINPDQTFQTIDYDHWTTTATDANGHFKKATADPFGRTVQVQEFMTGTLYATTTYGYDPLNRLIDTWDTANHNTHITYDRLGNKTAMSDPDMGDWSYVYDQAGNLVRQVDARGQSVCIDYDPLNRPTAKRAATNDYCFVNSPTISYTVSYGYDDTSNGNKGIGRRTALTDTLSGSSSWVYDLEGRVLTATLAITGAPQPYTTSWTYDAMSRPRSMTYPDGEVVTTDYNSQGLPSTLSTSPGQYVSQTDYNAAGELKMLRLGNNDLTTYSYFSNTLRLKDLVTTNSSNLVLQNLHYEYDYVGNILHITDGVQNETAEYQYDDLNRLLSASVTTSETPIYDQAWSYSHDGNILSRMDNGVGVAYGTPITTTYQYTDEAHRHAATQAGTNQYQYDANGNMTTRNGDVLTYDVENRLIQVSAAGGITTTTFLYDGDGNRVGKTVTIDGVITTTVYVGNYYEVTNGAATKYYYFGSQRVAMRDGNGVTYFHADHLGSMSVVVKPDGSTIEQKYYPFGSVRISSGSMPTDYGYTGQRADDSLNGLMDYGARFYDPQLGRFLSADTIVPDQFSSQSFNRYSYVRNNPVNFVDPTGHDDCAPEDTYCWQNRWFEAHGKCYSAQTDDWTKPCKPEFKDPGILGEVLSEKGGIEYLNRADPVQVLGMILEYAATLQQSLIPNMLILGVEGNAAFLSYYSGNMQLVFDYKHNQIAMFWGAGGGYGTPGASLVVQLGYAMCGPACTSIDSYGAFFLNYGASIGVPVEGVPLGVGVDYSISAGYPPFPWNTDSNSVRALTYSAGFSTPGPEAHINASYSGRMSMIASYGKGGDNQMALTTFVTVRQFTGDFGLATLMAMYAYIIMEEDPK